MMTFVRGSSILRREIQNERKKESGRKSGNDITIRKCNSTESGQSPLTQKVALKKSMMIIKEPGDKVVDNYRSNTEAESSMHM